jgi:hypothetical protein
MQETLDLIPSTKNKNKKPKTSKQQTNKKTTRKGY